MHKQKTNAFTVSTELRYICKTKRVQNFEYTDGDSAQKAKRGLSLYSIQPQERDALLTTKH